MGEKWVPVTDLIAVLDAMRTGNVKLEINMDVRQFAGIHLYDATAIEFERTIKFRMSQDG